jgi:hypothetical protein
VNGRKRHIVTDTLGLIVRVKVHSAEPQDREAIPFVLEGMKNNFHVYPMSGSIKDNRDWKAMDRRTLGMDG